MRHAGPIGISEQLIAQIQRGLKRRHFSKSGAWRGIGRLANEAEGIKASHALGHELLIAYPAEFPRHENAPFQQIGAGIRPSVAQEPTRFRMNRHRERLRGGTQKAKGSPEKRYPRRRMHPRYPPRNVSK